MKAFAERFFKDCAGQWKPSTLKTIRNFIQRSINPVLGPKTVDSIKPDIVHDFIGGLDVAPSTATRILSILSGMMNHAELWEMRSPDSNPFRGIRKRKSDFVAQYLSEQEFGRLGKAFNRLEATYPDAVQLFRFLALTGCRLGEARRLKWDIIDGHRVALLDAKGGPPAIWLGAPAKRLLASRPQTNATVFVTDDDPIKTSGITTAWGAVRQAARLPKLRVHDLRHNFANLTVTLSYDLRALLNWFSDYSATSAGGANQALGHFITIFTWGQHREQKPLPYDLPNPTRLIRRKRST